MENFLAETAQLLIRFLEPVDLLPGRFDLLHQLVEALLLLRQRLAIDLATADQLERCRRAFRARAKPWALRQMGNQP